MQKIVGKVAFTPKGNWEYSLHYEKLDVVVFNNTMYIALKEVPSGTDIDNKEYWQKSINGMGGNADVDTEMSDTSENAVQNKVIKAYVDEQTTTEQTVADWGFTKNTGTYNKPADGIPKTDLSSDVQTSLGKADTALQEHQDISGKVDKVGGKGLSTNDFNNHYKKRVEDTYTGKVVIDNSEVYVVRFGRIVQVILKNKARTLTNGQAIQSGLPKPYAQVIFLSYFASNKTPTFQINTNGTLNAGDAISNIWCGGSVTYLTWED